MSFRLRYLSFAVLALACRGPGAEEPIDLAASACCRVSNPEMTSFAGCRLGERCRSEEPIWIRGKVTCGAVDEAACVGGRCCRYLTREEDPAFSWSGGEAPGEEAPADGASSSSPEEAASPGDLEPADAEPDE